MKPSIIAFVQPVSILILSRENKYLVNDVHPTEFKQDYNNKAGLTVLQVRTVIGCVPKFLIIGVLPKTRSGTFWKDHAT